MVEADAKTTTTVPTKLVLIPHLHTGITVPLHRFYSTNNRLRERRHFLLSRFGIAADELDWLPYFKKGASWQYASEWPTPACLISLIQSVSERIRQLPPADYAKALSQQITHPWTRETKEQKYLLSFLLHHENHHVGEIRMALDMLAIDSPSDLSMG